MNNVGERFLPIGTVVMLSGGSKRVMITGFCSMAAEDQNVMYDYAGCMYPEGFLSSDQTALFNHSQIERVYHLGLVDEEEQKFKTSLNALVNQMNGGVANVTSEQPVTNPVVPETITVQQQVATQPEVIDVPPIGPGLPGYVAPTPLTSPQVEQQVVAPVSPTVSEFQFDANGNVIAAPQPEVQQQAGPMNIQFDENGTVVSA